MKQTYFASYLQTTFSLTSQHLQTSIKIEMRNSLNYILFRLFGTNFSLFMQFFSQTFKHPHLILFGNRLSTTNYQNASLKSSLVIQRHLYCSIERSSPRRFQLNFEDIILLVNFLCQVSFVLLLNIQIKLNLFKIQEHFFVNNGQNWEPVQLNISIKRRLDKISTWAVHLNAS